jgi:membrane-associated phospholipid phosphatase
MAVAGESLRGFPELDLAGYRRVRSLARGDVVTWARRYSRLGEHGALWLASGTVAALLDRPRRRRWARATATVGAGYVISTSIKLVVRRRRPVVADLPALIGTRTTLSFPSSHAVTSFAALRAFGPLVPRAPLAAVAVTMSLSRLFLGVHYPSDVAAGAVLGTLIGGFGR